MMILAYFRVMYTVGYSLSLASLSLAFVILLIFRQVTAFLQKSEQNMACRRRKNTI